MIEDDLAVDEDRIDAASGEKIGETADAGLQEPAHHIGAVAKYSERMRAQIGTREARRISGADDGAHRTAGDRRHPQAEFVDRFEQRDMGDAARAAAAERNRDRRRTAAHRLQTVLPRRRRLARSPAACVHIAIHPSAGPAAFHIIAKS